MLGINLTVFETGGEKRLMLKYSIAGNAGHRSYRIEQTNFMAKDFRELLKTQKESDMEIIVLTSVVQEEGHEEYNSIGMKETLLFFKNYFRQSKITYDTTQSLNNIQ